MSSCLAALRARGGGGPPPGGGAPVWVLGITPPGMVIAVRFNIYYKYMFSCPEAAMSFPAFFALAPTLTLHDPLAVFLGASDSGDITYTYADAVKLAGHSCPTVAGAWLMLRHGLTRIYGNQIPQRGAIEVYMRDARDHGTTGVIAAIATLLTGAAPETGFGGIGARGRFARRDLLHFDTPIGGLMGVRRRDTGQGVILDLDTARVPAGPQMAALFPIVATEGASADEHKRFGALWQERVEKMLTAHADDPALVIVRAWDDKGTDAAA